MTESARNLSDLQDAIRAKHGERYYLSPAAMWEAAALWGVTPETGGINDCGVFTSLIDVIRFCHLRCKAKITLVETPNGFWAMSTTLQMHDEGRTYAPSIWNEWAFPTRDNARFAGLCELIGFLQSAVEPRYSTNSATNQQELRQMIVLLEAEKSQQLSLF